MADVLRLVASGVSLTDIARQLGCTDTQATERIAAAAKETAAAGMDRDTQVQVELAHLDMLRRIMTEGALRGNTPEARVLVRIHEARAALLGLTQTEQADTEDEEVSVVDDLRARRARRQAAAD